MSQGEIVFKDNNGDLLVDIKVEETYGLSGRLFKIAFENNGLSGFRMSHNGDFSFKNGVGISRFRYYTNYLTQVGNLELTDMNGNAHIKICSDGQIWAQEITVQTVPFPDYVFEDTYKLPSLKEIENYIKQNKHLPEIPSALSVEQNGIQLGEMNVILLKKIEELTLHIIELNKKVEKLENLSNCK